jgi:SM-20-related protein
MHGSSIDYEETAICFRDKRYLYVKNFLPKAVLDYLKVYYQILRANDRLDKDGQCPLSLAVGGDPALDAVLGWKNPDVSRLVGFDLAPTYSYTRIYAKDEILTRHSDRAACEISVSVSIEIPKDAGPSVLHLKPPNMPETTIEMFEGDACVYAGAEVEHWREPFSQDGYIQLFLHFIDKHGEHFPKLTYDKRKYLGAPYVPSALPMQVSYVREAAIMEHSEQIKELSEQKISVTLLLKGGYQRCVKLDVTDPSLLSLLEIVAKRNDEKTKATIFNLEMENGEGSLFFSASDLIALSTNPAISIDLQIDNPNVEFSNIIKENYLSDENLATLLKFVEAHASEFKPSKVFGSRRSKARRSLVLDDLGDFGEMFRERVRSDLPAVLKKLQIPYFTISEIECQITSHNDDHYFVRHIDSGISATSRVVTFVYYFHNEPRRFDGGSLRLYKGKLENGIYTCGETNVDINPKNNTMLFFPSACYHEVLPIKCSSGEFKDSRFTVNGWVRMAK